MAHPHLADLVALGLGQGTIVDQPLLEDVKRGRVLVDFLVHRGLCEMWLIELVVAVPAVADHVDDYIGSPLLPPLDGRLESGGDGEGVVSVDVEDGAVEGLA